MATPKSQAWTSQAIASEDEARRLWLETVAELVLVASGQAAETSGEEVLPLDATSFCCRYKSVTSGASDLSTSTETPTTYRAELRLQSAIRTAAKAARAVPCHRKWRRDQPKACIAWGESQWDMAVIIGGSFRSRRAAGAALQFLRARLCVRS